MATYMIETEHLQKTYHGQTVVDRLNLHVPEGGVYGFIGPNGAGKSTTMKMMLGLVKPDRGSIRLMGETMSEKNRVSILRRTGSLIESPSHYGHLTAQENLEIVALLKDVKKGEIDRVLDIVDLRPARNKKVRAFSLGMKQRLGIAMALLGDPKLLILDEPTNGLDPEGIYEMRDLVKRLPKDFCVTVFVSSHLLSEVEQMADTVGVIHHGKLLFEGTLSELRANHERSSLEEFFFSLTKENGGSHTWGK